MATSTVKTKRAEKPAARTSKTLPPQPTTASGDLQRRIEEKAYELFKRRGCMHGNDVLDWTLAQDLVELENKAASFRKFRNADIRSEDLKEEIEKRAYELYEYRGHAHGNDIFDWSLAEEIAFLRSGVR